jgi:hypothetical protein
MNAFQKGYGEFRDLALQTGYTRKIVGDYAYRKPRRKKGKFQYIKLQSISRDGDIKIRWYEQ